MYVNRLSASDYQRPKLFRFLNNSVLLQYILYSNDNVKLLSSVPSRAHCSFADQRQQIEKQAAAQKMHLHEHRQLSLSKYIWSLTYVYRSWHTVPSWKMNLYRQRWSLCVANRTTISSDMNHSSQNLTLRNLPSGREEWSSLSDIVIIHHHSHCQNSDSTLWN